MKIDRNPLRVRPERARTEVARTEVPRTEEPAQAERAPSDAARARLGENVAKAPVATSSAGNVRGAWIAHVQEREVDRRFLKTAYKELARSTSLADHLALRSLAPDDATRAAFDEIMKAHADALVPQVLDAAHVFAGAAALVELQGAARAMGAGVAFDDAVRAELRLALGWSKTDHERADVLALAARLDIAPASLVEASAGPVYEASPKHHGSTVQGGFVSPAPTNGQAALDASVQVKPESARRVSVDKEAGEYVVFDETTAGVFHGHTRTWDQLHPDMQRALVAAGLTTNNGRAL